MNFSDIKLLPATNAVGQVYANVTGNAYIGQVMSGAGIATGNPVVYYIAYGDASATVETSRGTGKQTGETANDRQEVEILANNNYPELEGAKVWFSDQAEPDDDTAWAMYATSETAEATLYVKFYTTDPSANE